MKGFTTIVCALALVAAVGCGKDEADKQERGGGAAKARVTGCDTAASKLVFARAAHFDVGAKLTDLAVAVAKACNEHAWPDEVRECAGALGPKDDAGAKACMDRLDADAKAKTAADIATAARAAGSSATW